MKVTVKTVVPQSLEVVFDFVADMRNDVHWAPMVQDVEQVEGDGPGEGARYRFIQQMGRHQVPMESTITAYERPERLSWRIDHRAMDYGASMRLEPHRKGTRIVQTNTETWHFAPWHLRIVAPLLVKRQLRRQLALLARALSREEEKEKA